MRIGETYGEAKLEELVQVGSERLGDGGHQIGQTLHRLIVVLLGADHMLADLQKKMF